MLDFGHWRSAIDAIAAAVFGAIEGEIGFADQMVRIVDRRGVAPGDTNAAGNGEGISAGQEGGAGDGFANAFGLLAGGGAGTTGKDDEELFAAIAADGIVAADGGLDALGGFAQDGIAGEMAAGIVDKFEAVEIHEKDGDGLMFALGAREFVLQGLQGWSRG